MLDSAIDWFNVLSFTILGLSIGLTGLAARKLSAWAIAVLCCSWMWILVEEEILYFSLPKEWMTGFALYAAAMTMILIQKSITNQQTASVVGSLIMAAACLQLFFRNEERSADIFALFLLGYAGSCLMNHWFSKRNPLWMSAFWYAVTGTVLIVWQTGPISGLDIFSASIPFTIIYGVLVLMFFTVNLKTAEYLEITEPEAWNGNSIWNFRFEERRKIKPKENLWLDRDKELRTAYEIALHEAQKNEQKDLDRIS